MKEKFRIGMFNFSVLCFLVLFTNALIAQSQDVYSIERSLSTKGIKSLKIHSYDVNTRILPSSDKTIKVKLTFEALSDKDGEIDKLKSFLETTLIQSKEDELYITNVGAKKATFDNRTNNEKAKLVFDDGRVKLKTLDWILMEIYIPENMDLALNSYFSKTTLSFPFKGALEVIAYESELNAVSYDGDLHISDANFSKLYFGNLKKAKIKLNDSDFQASSIQEWDLDSRFSDIKVGTSKSFVYNGFEDKLVMSAATKFNIKSNFSEITIDEVNKIAGELFEGSLVMAICDDAVLICKHAEVEVQNIRILKVRNCFESEFNVDTLGSLYSLNGEFNEFNIGYLKKTFSIQCSQAEANLFETAKDFEYIYLGGKFLESEIHVNKHSSYRLEAEVQFSEIELNKSDYTVELYDKNYSDEKFIYHYGSDSKNSNIRITGYEMDVELIHGSKPKHNLKLNYNPMSNPYNYLNNWIIVEKDGLYGFIDNKGIQVVPTQYNIIHPFDEYQIKWALVQKDEKYGFIDNKGREIVAVKYDKINQFGEFFNTWALVELEGKYGFIDMKGNEVVEPIYDKIEYLDGLVGSRDGKQESLGHP